MIAQNDVEIVLRSFCPAVYIFCFVHIPIPYKYIHTVHIYSYKAVLCFLTTVGVNLFSPLFSYFKGSNVSPEVDRPLIKG